MAVARRSGFVCMCKKPNGALLVVRSIKNTPTPSIYVPEVVWSAAETADEKIVVPFISTRPTMTVDELKFVELQGMENAFKHEKVSI